jgi:hypothetical protein
MAAAEHRAEDAKRLLTLADEQLAEAMAKLAETKPWH